MDHVPGYRCGAQEALSTGKRIASGGSTAPAVLLAHAQAVAEVGQCAISASVDHRHIEAEAKAEQLEMARRQGDAYHKALQEMTKREADTGLEATAGEYTVAVTVIDERGQEVGRHEHPFLWHPWIYHYGRNWTLPSEGIYTIIVNVDVPMFPRHDKKNGQRYLKPAEVRFENVSIKTGQK